MAKAFKCDRCGKLFEYDDEHRKNTQSLVVYNLGYACDLCANCDKMLENWFRNKEEKDEIES